MSNTMQFRRSTAILTLVAASIGGGLIAAFAVATHSKTPVYVTAKADTAAIAKLTSLSNSFADVIEKASPAIVNIDRRESSKRLQQQGENPFMADPFFRQFFGGGNGQMQRPRDQREQGSARV